MNIEEKLTEIEKKIIEELKKDPKISQWKLSIKLNRNEANIRRHMRILKLVGILRRVGPNHKDGHWEIIETKV